MKNMKYTTARMLYNDIGQKYHDNREKASNDVTELPTTLRLLGDVKGKRILDMGCGLGKHAKEFIRRGAIVTGYDASEKMVAFTQAHCGGKGTFFCSTHEKVFFRPHSFDICNASLSINYSKNLEVIFKHVHSWLTRGGIFTFSIPHPVWLLARVQDMDYSKPHRIWIEMKSYDVNIFNYYYPLDVFIQLINAYDFTFLHLIETTISRKQRGWSEEKYRIPNTYVFKLQKTL